MAIEVIPKKAESETPSAINALFYFCLILSFAAIAAWLALNYYSKKSEATLEGIENVIAQKETPERKALENAVLAYKSKLDQILPLFASHQKSSAFFPFFERLSHPKVYFSSLALDAKGFQATISGEAESFEAVAQQIYIFKKEKFIKNTNLSGISIGKEGKINFSAVLSLDSQLFRY